MSEHHPEVELLLVGDGSDASAVDDAIATLPAGANTRSVGWQEDVAAWLDQIDVFVHPSRAEPFGLAVLEAMALGLPVVAYGDGGVGEIIVDGESGFLHEPGDIAGLSASVERLVADRELRRRVGAAARERVGQHFEPATAGSVFGELLTALSGRLTSQRPLPD